MVINGLGDNGGGTVGSTTYFVKEGHCKALELDPRLSWGRFLADFGRTAWASLEVSLKFRRVPLDLRLGTQIDTPRGRNKGFDLNFLAPHGRGKGFDLIWCAL